MRFSAAASVQEDDIVAVADRDLPWDVLSGAHVVVTGAAGFLGRYITSTLLKLHALKKVAVPIRVTAIVRNIARARDRLDDHIADRNLNLYEWDLSSIAVPQLPGCNYIIHAASQASPRFYGTDPVGTLLPNTVGSAALLEALRRSSDARGFLFISSSEVYGSVTREEPISENGYGIVDPVNVRSSYAESKRMGETMCVAWHHQYGIPAFIVRPFHTYGPGLLPEDGRVFSDFAFNVARGENIVMKSDGTARRAFCYVSDAVAGIFSVLLRGEPIVPYNVANPDGELSVMELAELLVGLFPEKRLSVVRMKAGEATYLPSAYSRLIPDVSRLRTLGWFPKIGPVEGFRRMIEACSA